MGECFNGNSDYVGPYQNYLSALFNYPMYYSIKDVFMYGQSMYSIRNRYSEVDSKFADVDALGVFVDNHDNARFLCSSSDHALFKAAIMFSLTSRGIPFFYYGSEQYFGGCNDPKNREQLWTNMDTSTDLYQEVAIVNNLRKTYQFWNNPYVERYVDDSFLAYTRGDVFVALTNTHNTIKRTITYHPYSDGTTLCNVFYSGDCVKVQNGSFEVDLLNAEVKIFVPSYGSEIVE